MSAVGPGDWLRACWSGHHNHDPSKRHRLTGGAIYQVAEIMQGGGPGDNPCERCGGAIGVLLVGQPIVWPTGGLLCWCLCCFTPWPEPADEAMRCEEIDQDEPVPA